MNSALTIRAINPRISVNQYPWTNLSELISIKSLFLMINYFHSSFHHLVLHQSSCSLYLYNHHALQIHIWVKRAIQGIKNHINNIFTLASTIKSELAHQCCAQTPTNQLIPNPLFIFDSITISCICNHSPFNNMLMYNTQTIFAMSSLIQENYN